jgi:hypothetical protein
MSNPREQRLTNVIGLILIVLALLLLFFMYEEEHNEKYRPTSVGNQRRP